MTTVPKAKSTPPKGGKKGGSVYPRVALPKAIEYATKLVAKTHTGPQPRNIVGPGVFGSGGTKANERISALRQFGLLLGTDKSGYQASPFAKQLVGAAEDKPKLIKDACLKPNILAKLHNTFLGDTISKARIKQQILALNVHPDSADNCLKEVVESLVYSKLWEDVGNDNFKVLSDTGFTTSNEEPEGAKEPESTQTDEEGESPPLDRTEKTPPIALPFNSNIISKPSHQKANLEIKIDPSMDPEKLDRLLGVLRKYGQI
jgi:hypothetical protein